MDNRGMKMNDLELKPCPFCGGRVDYWHDIELNPVGVQCHTCKMFVRMSGMKQGKVFGDTMARIAERWNRRINNE